LKVEVSTEHGDQLVWRSANGNGTPTDSLFVSIFDLPPDSADLLIIRVSVNDRVVFEGQASRRRLD
jgi:hypothetical protein